MSNIVKTIALILGLSVLAFFCLTLAKVVSKRSVPLMTGVVTQGRYMDIDAYVKQNIGNLSPIEPSLGGTFYVTAIESHGGTGTVSYEDGHNAYTADFAYEISQEGRPSVTSFTVRK